MRRGPLTPRPVPFDIDRHETRVMPKTPPVSGPPPLPAAATAWRTPPPVPQTPVPSPTAVTPGPPPSQWTSGAAPTVFTSAGGATGPFARAATPPPLPPPGTIFEPPRARRRGKRRWWLWAVGAVVVVSFCNRDRDRSGSRSSREEAPKASPSAEVSVDGDAVETEARVVPDREIEKAVERAFRSNPRTRRQDIDVDADEGIVTLSGRAPAAAAREAEAMARRTPGVHEVLNTIEVDEEERGVPGPEGPPGVHAEPPSPPGAPLPGLISGIFQEAVQQLLRQGRESLKAGNAEAALGTFGAALGMDPSNEEARRGLEDAKKMSEAQRRARGQRRGPSPDPQ